MPVPDDDAWRERKRAEGGAGARTGRSRGSARFEPLNALLASGWLPLVPPIELRAWLVLYRFADRNGRVCVSHGRIAALAGVRREHAARATRSLERRGLLRVRVRGRTVGERGRRTANAYELLASLPVPPGGNAARDSPEESDDDGPRPS